MAGVARNLVARAGIDLSAWEKNLKKMQKSLQKTSKKLQSVGKTMSMGVTAPIIGFATLATKGMQESRMDFAKLEANALMAGVSVDRLNKHMKNLNAITGETDSNVEALSNVMAAGFKNAEMDKVIESLSGAVIKFPDTLKIEGLADGLQETLATGKAIGPFAEMLERLGFKLDDFNVGLMRASKSGTEHQYILDTLAKAGLSDVTKAYIENNQELIENANAQYNWKQQLLEIGDKILPIFTRLTDILSKVMNAFNNLTPAQQDMVVNMAVVAASVGPVLIVVGKLIGSFKTIGAVIGALSGPIGLIVAAVAALVGVFVHLYKTNEEFRSSLDGLFNGMKENFIVIGDMLKKLWEENKDVIMPILEGIQELIASVLIGTIEKLSGALDIVTGILTGDWDKALKGVSEWLHGFLSPVLKLLELFFDVEVTAESISGWIETIIGLTSNAINDIKEWINSIPTLFSDIKDGIVTIFRSVPKLVVNPIIDAFNKLLNGINDNLEIKIPDWVPGYGGKTFGVNLPNIPKLAKGGIVMPKPGGVLANIAEAGKPEAVIPLDKLGSFGGNQPINIYLGNKLLGSFIIDQFGRQLQLQSGFRG